MTSNMNENQKINSKSESKKVHVYR